MRAVVITAPGGPEVLEIQDRPAPEPGRSEIRVSVRASALNRADLLQRRGLYPPPAGYPADVPGLEYAGIVESLGPDVHMWRVGDRVMGIIGGAGHAELVCVHEREAIPVPERMGWPEAAAIPEAFLTAYDALFRRLRVQPGETVLVHAVASGVGTAALQLANLAGARVFGTSRSADKLAALSDIGLRHPVDSSIDDWPDRLRSQLAGGRVDAIVDLVGGALIATDLTLIAERGRIVVVGTMGGSRVELDLRALMARRATLMGTVLRARPIEEKIELARAFAKTMVPRFESGDLRPVVDSVHSFDDVVEAHRRMEANRNVGKIVLTW